MAAMNGHGSNVGGSVATVLQFDLDFGHPGAI